MARVGGMTGRAFTRIAIAALISVNGELTDRLRDRVDGARNGRDGHSRARRDVNARRGWCCGKQIEKRGVW